MRSRTIRASLAGTAAVSALAAGGLVGPAQAQQTPGAQRPAAIEEIVVTARKRAERIVDVPFAITAVSGSEISARGAVDIKDLQFSIPGINITQTFAGADKVQMRGVSPGSGTGLPIVGIYVDEVGVSIDQQQRDGGFPLVDLERIEVLRGPQGTAYGQGSLAGTIRYLTRNPDLDATDGFAEGNVYSQSEGGTGFRVNAAVGMPIVKGKAGLRIAGGVEKQAGWIDYTAIGQEDANESERRYIRPKLLLRPNERLTLTAMYQYYELEADTDNISGFDGVSQRNRPTLYPASDKFHLVNLIGEYDFGPVTLTASSGYQFREFVLRGAVGLPPPSVAVLIAPTDYEQISHEVRLSSNGAGPISYVIGAWYREFTSTIDRLITINGAPTTIFRRVGTDPVDSESYAVFGEVTWSATDRLDLSLGGRYYDDERETGSTVPVAATITANFDKFSPRLNASYKLDDVSTVYATVSQGFRSGGFNANNSTYGPETLWNYEVGTKSSLMGGRLFLDAAVYYLDYKDRQSQNLLPIAGTTSFVAVTNNTGSASGLGAELGLTARFDRGFQLDLTGAYNDVTNDEASVEFREGERFNFVPEFTGSAALSQSFPVAADMTGFWRVDFQYASDQQSVIRQAGAVPPGSPPGTPPAIVVLEDFDLGAQTYLNLRAGVEWRSWTVTLEANNVLDEDAYIFTNPPVASTREGVHARPASYGVTVRTTF